MTLNCAIIDNDQQSSELLKNYIDTSPTLLLTTVFLDAKAAAHKICCEDNIDILFLDIEMAQVPGINLIHNLHSKVKSIILITTQPLYAVKAFELPVADFLLKPISFPRFFHAISKVERQHCIQRKMPVHRKEDFFIRSLNNYNKLINCRYDEVIAVEVRGKELQLHTRSQTFSTLLTMYEMEAELAHREDFIRVHRSFIISKRFIDNVQDNVVTMKYLDLKFTIGDHYRKNLFDYINSKILKPKKKA